MLYTGIGSKSKNDDADVFLFYLMSQVNLADYSGGIVPSVNKSTIEAITVLIPHNPSEQQKIADCLSSMDSLIQNQQKVVTTWQQRKKALLQQMFI